MNNLSFEVHEGQVFGIAGPNGAGKSTLYNLITGFHSYEGTIEFKGSKDDALNNEDLKEIFLGL